MRHIVAARCRFCHTAIPQEDGLNAASQPPKGVKFDSPEDIRALAARIEEQAITSRRMPPDNATHMTDAERATVAAWIAGGAKLPQGGAPAKAGAQGELSKVGGLTP